MTPDVYSASEKLENAGVSFQKRPNEGRMQGLAFALDPDGYWIEIVRRSSASTINKNFTFEQTMMRVKDPVKSLHFYRDILGMTLIREKHLGVGEEWGFSLYFLAHLPNGIEIPSPDSTEADEFMKCMFEPVLELTHNHGTEKNPDFKYKIR